MSEASPQEFGWIIGGRTVAPAVVDPYLRMKPIAHKILDHAKVAVAVYEIVPPKALPHPSRA
eukprot:2796042-Amphidinium_carterae.1